VIERLNFDDTWIGQELMVYSGKKGRGAHIWFLTITDKVKHGNETTLTLQSFEEDDYTGGIPAGNVYVVTHPYLAPPEPKATDPQPVVLGIAELHGLPPQAHEVRGEAIIVSFFALLSRAMKAAHERRALAGH
jgi:hypothetical protein